MAREKIERKIALFSLPTVVGYIKHMEANENKQFTIFVHVKVF